MSTERIYLPLGPSLRESADRLRSKFRHLPALWVSPEARLRASIPVFSHPVVLKSGVWISQHFGENPSDYRPLNGHDGMDYAIMTGGDCMCTSEWQRITNLILQTGSYGRHAWTVDENGDRHIYGHLSQFLCEVGQEMTRGQVFARTGGGPEDPYKGYSSGPHLHWEWRPKTASISNGYAGAVDQEPYITFQGVVTPTPLNLPEPLYYLVARAKMKIRRSAKGGIWTNLTGKYVEKGERVPVYKTSLEGRTWAQTDQGFVCIQENSDVYLEVEQEE